MSYTHVNTAMAQMNVTNSTASNEQRKTALLYAFEHDLPFAWSTLQQMLKDLEADSNNRAVREFDVKSDTYKQMIRMFAATVPTMILTQEYGIHMAFYSGGKFIIAKTAEALNVNLKEQTAILVQQGYVAIANHLEEQGVNNEAASDEQRAAALLHHC